MNMNVLVYIIYYPAPTGDQQLSNKLSNKHAFRNFMFAKGFSQYPFFNTLGLDCLETVDNLLSPFQISGFVCNGKGNFNRLRLKTFYYIKI